MRNALEAKAFVLMAVRHGPIENIHAGHMNCPTCGASIIRIGDLEMKEIIKFAVDRVATLLMLRETNSEQYEGLVVWASAYVRNWDDPEIVQGYLRNAIRAVDNDDLLGSIQ